MAGGVSQWFRGVVIYQVSGRLHKSTMIYRVCIYSNFSAYINMCLDLHVPIQYLECVGRAALFTFSVSEQAPYIYMYIQFFIMYMYIVT